ncbi:MAG: GAF domain-containing protein [Dokdonella sp.]
MHTSAQGFDRAAQDGFSAKTALSFAPSLLDAGELAALAALVQEQASRELDGVDTLLLWALDWPSVWSKVSPRTLTVEQSALLQVAAINPLVPAFGHEGSGLPLAQCAASGTGRAVLLCIFEGEASPAGRAQCETFFALVRPYLVNALEKACLRESLDRIEQSDKLQRALFAIADMASSELDMPEMLRGLHKIVGSLMYAENFYIALHGTTNDTICFLYYVDVADTNPPPIGESDSMAEREFSLTWYLIRDGRPLMGSEIELREQVSGPLRVLGGADFSDWLGVPMTRGNVVYGALVVQTYVERPRYTLQDQALLSFVGNHILTALERKQAHEELERRVEHRTQELAKANEVLTAEVLERQRGERLQAALYQIAALTSSAETAAGFYTQIHRIISELLDGENFSIALLSEDGLTLTYPYVHDLQENNWSLKPRGRGRTEYVLRTGHTQIINRGRLAELVAAGEIDRESVGTLAHLWLGVPLLVGERLIGVLAVQSYTNENAYTAADAELIGFVAAQLAGGMQLLRETSERKRSERLQSALYQIAALANSDESSDSFFEHVRENISGLVNADNFYIALLSEDGNSLEFAYWVDQHAPRPATRPLGRGLSEYTLRSGHAVLVQSQQTARALVEAGEISAEYLNSPTHCWLSAPLIGSESALGVVVVQSYTLELSYDQRDAELLTFVSYQLASSIQRRRAAQALRLSNVRLEERVAARTNELSEQISVRQLVELALQQRNNDLEVLNRKLAGTQSQLLQSEKMASVGQLAAGVAHEINNPIGYVRSNLTSLTGYVQEILSVLQAYETLEKTPPNAPPQWASVQALKQTIQLDYIREDIINLLSESVEGVTRVEKIVKDLKDFSHVDQAEWMEADIHDCIDSTLNVVWHELKYKGNLVKEYGDIPPVQCLPFQLKQVFLNLLVNAGHATERRGTITIRTGREREHVWISIADTGSGIDPSHMNRIFEPFFTTKPVGTGTGLGLSVSYSIIQKHAGTIEVASDLGEGTTFTIRLPIAQVDIANV